MRFEPGWVGDSESDQHQGARRKTWQGRKKSWRGIIHNLRGRSGENTRRKSIREGILWRRYETINNSFLIGFYMNFALKICCSSAASISMNVF